MRFVKATIAIVLFFFTLPFTGQTTFEEIEFEQDSISKAYKPTGNNFAFIRSKRGNSGVAKTPVADAILTAEVTEIVLVYSEVDPSALAEREEANKERWENLLMTYPELFQFSTTYKNICQCKNGGDAEALKPTQGFYVYINGVVPKIEEPKTEAPVVAKTEEKKPVEEAPVTKTPKKEEKTAPAKETPPVNNSGTKTKETPAVVEKTETPVAKEPVKEISQPVTNENQEETPAAAEPVKEPSKKKVAAAKPRRAKDPKACRPPCYGYGDEDLYTFFKDNITLTKKQRRKAKNWIANVRLQINFDGSIKKAMVTGSEQDFNKMVEEVLKSMNSWNSAVKGGLSVKSEVRFTLKYDKETKAMKPFDMNMNPRPSAKCVCVSDSEIFGSD